MMRTVQIRSKDANFQKFIVLKTNRNKRYKYNQFFVEGVRNLNEAVRNGWHVSSFLYSGARPLSGWATDMLKNVHTDVNYELSPELLAELSGKEDTSELMAIVEMRSDDLNAVSFSPNPLIALFDRPSNRGNLGTVIRSCDSLGIECLIITGHAVDLYDPDTVVSTMGSFFNVPVIRVPDNKTVQEFVSSMKEKYPGFKAIGTTAHKEKTISDLDMKTPTMLMIGNETDGLCGAFKELCDVQGTIPMAPDSSASSFNVACAATVMFYEARRQRGYLFD